MNSLPQGKDFIKNWVTAHKDEINFILDVGAGCGTYYKLLSDIKDFGFDAVEIWKPYINKYLKTDPVTYKVIFDIDIRGYLFKNKDYDLIIFGDVLEHLEMEEAKKVIDRARQCCKYFIISIPVSHCPQNMEHGNPHQKHIEEDYTSEKIIELFGPFEEFHLFECKTGRHGRPLNNPIDIGVFIGQGKFTTIS